MTRSTVFCLTLVLLLLQACQGFVGCGDAERSEGHAVRPDDTAPDRANREGACLRRAAGLTVRRLRRANTWARSPAGPPPELPTVEGVPEGAGEIPVGTDALETIQLSLGPETVHLGEHLVHERDQKGAYTPDEVDAFGSTLEERWSDLTDRRRKLLKRGRDDADLEFSLLILASPDLELETLRRIVSFLPDNPSMSVAVAPEPLQADVADQPAESDESLDQLIDRAAGECTGLEHALEPDGDREVVSGQHPTRQVRFAQKNDSSSRLPDRPTHGLLAIRKCGCETIDLDALEAVWTRNMLPPMRRVRTVPMDREELSEPGDRNLGQWATSRPAAASEPEGTTPACLADAIEANFWYGFTRAWHRPRGVSGALPRVPEAPDVDEKKLGSLTLDISADRIRLGDTDLDRRPADGESPTPVLEEMNGDLREHVDEELSSKQQEQKMMGREPVDQLDLAIAADPDLSTDALQTVVEALGDRVRYHLVVADESQPPPSPARPEVSWVEQTLADADRAESDQERFQLIEEAADRIAGDCEEVSTWIANRLLPASRPGRSGLIGPTSLTEPLRDCDCSQVDLQALEALTIGYELPFVPVPTTLGLSPKALRETDAETIGELARTLAADRLD